MERIWKRGLDLVLYVAQKPPTILKKQGTLSGAPTKKKNLNPRARFFTERQQKFQGLGFLPS